VKRMKRDEPVELIVHGSAELQYLPSCGELVLDPSYNVTLSQPQLPHASIENSSNVTDTTYNNTTVSQKNVHLFAEYRWRHMFNSAKFG